MNRQRLLLLILVVLLVVALIWSYSHMPRQKTVSDLKTAPGQRSPTLGTKLPTASQAPAGSLQSNVLRVDLLNREPTTFKGYYRNLFKPIFIDEIKTLKRKSAAIKPVFVPRSAPPRIVPVQPFALMEPPKRELAKFTFLGFLKKDNHKTIFLARDNDIILVKKGDTFAGRYEAASITDQALTILVTDTREEIVIPLIENRFLGWAQ